jgi:asparagine synthase (glutamine-hydrolysing)
VCGIAGVLSRQSEPPSIEQLGAMAASLSHRGPDEFGVYRDATAGLAHARLSIIDLSTGQQPLCNEKRDLWVVFNGEIFNYVELRAELLALGHVFRTQSDTEVIVHAFEAWGEEAFNRFNGQYAIALWQTEAKTLTLVRDRVGVRPLYYMEHHGRVYFASEIKAIFAGDRTLPREIDPIGIDETFTFWSSIAPRSVFKDVVELPPGHVRVYSPDGGVQEHAFWQPSYPVGEQGRFLGTVEEAEGAVLEALQRATELRMLRADVAVGSYLSGGLDSSLVAALGLRAKGERFRTYSLRFEDAEFDETGFQREMQRFLGSDHAEVVISQRHIAEVFPEVIAHTERPILRTAPAPMFLLSRLVRASGIKVVLTGEGADEMFAGYDIFREAKVRRFWARQPTSERRPRLLEKLYPYLARSPVAQQAMARKFFGRGLDQAHLPGFSHQPRWQGAAALKRLFSEQQRQSTRSLDVIAGLLARLPQDFSRWSSLAQDQYLEVRTLLPGYILSSQGDRMLMANSVEGRFPFLDANVMRLAASLPDSYKLKVLDEKHILKRIGRGLVPPSILARKKQPYRAPDAACFVSPDAPDWVNDVTSAASVTAAGIFEPKAVEQLLQKCRGRSSSPFSNADNMAVVGVLSTQLLHRQFIEDSISNRRIPRFSTCIDCLG